MSGNVLIVDDDRNMRELLEEDLRLRGFEPMAANSAGSAWRSLSDENFDVVLTDVRMPGTTGIQLCQQIASGYPDLPVIVMTAFGSLESAVDALRAGAYDFVTKPIELDLLAVALQRAVRNRRLQRQVRQLAETVDHKAYFGEILGESPAMQRIYSQLTQIVATDTSVMLTGESGTGKELVARSVHRRSHRASGPFVAVNCAAIPEALLESELFGHAKGAFTDARQERQGLFQRAENGTLFLDEIGELPLAMQVKLLRALEERTVRPVGSDDEVPIDVRVISATNRDLEAAVEEQRFRGDLYYRINVIQIELPPLRSRGADVLILAQHFLQSYAASMNKPLVGFHEVAAERLLAYSWPGNVRELRNVVERATALTTFDRIQVDDLPEKIRQHRSSQIVLDADDPSCLVPLEQVERRYILHVMEAACGNRTQAAQILGLDRKTLYRKLKQYGLEK